MRSDAATSRKRDFPWWVLPPLVLLGLFYGYLVTKVGYDVASGGPDEHTRLMIAKAILQGKLLPSGWGT